MTNTLEFGSVVIIRRMSLAVAATICTSQLRQLPHFVDQEQVRRLGDRDGQHAADEKQRQHQVRFDVLARQQFDDLRIVQPGFELGVGHAVFVGQALDDLIFGAKPLLDQNFAQQLSLPWSACCASSARCSVSAVR